MPPRKTIRAVTAITVQSEAKASPCGAIEKPALLNADTALKRDSIAVCVDRSSTHHSLRISTVNASTCAAIANEAIPMTMRTIPPRPKPQFSPP